MKTENFEPTLDDNFYMKRALVLAEAGAAAGEVPVGSVVVQEGEIISEARNEKEALGSCIAHAEILALHRACKKMGAWRLSNATLYSTLEPCAMCAGALVQARVKRVVFGARDPKAGALCSVFEIGSSSKLNHKFEFTEGVLAEESTRILRSFFKQRR